MYNKPFDFNSKARAVAMLLLGHKLRDVKSKYKCGETSLRDWSNDPNIISRARELADRELIELAEMRETAILAIEAYNNKMLSTLVGSQHKDLVEDMLDGKPTSEVAEINSVSTDKVWRVKRYWQSKGMIIDGYNNVV